MVSRGWKEVAFGKRNLQTPGELKEGVLFGVGHNFCPFESTGMQEAYATHMLNFNFT